MELQLRGITKRFPGVLANDSVDFTARSGEILGLLGENGAGKTTLMNILYGLYSADEGEIIIDGEGRHFAGPGDAIEAGIGMVHQHFMLVPVFTVTENVVLGVEPTRVAGIMNMKEAAREVREISARYRLEVDPDAIVEEIPVGIQQRVEIIKVLFREAEFLIFDEPTAVLTPQEVEEFFEIIRGLRDAGKAVIFITHKLKEVLEVSDRIVVLRGGKVVGDTAPGDTTQEALAEMMVGRPVDLVVSKSAAASGDMVLKVEGLFVADDRDQMTVNGLSFEVKAGEIVGIAGVQGNGQTELVQMLTGMRPAASGTVELSGEDVTAEHPRGIHRRGVAHIPEDRQRSGLVMNFTVTENMILNRYYDPPYSKGIVMDWGAAGAATTKLVEQFDVRTPSISIPASSLSGGNQQKVIVAREFSRDVKLIIAAQPTRGLDVGSIEYIHGRIVEARDDGAGILMVSTELDEVMALSDRLLVMFGGKIVAELDPQQVSAADVGLYMAGAAP
ncbi:MAG: ABC transporter ATP-binding protein [Acidimicrobiia bacterium]